MLKQDTTLISQDSFPNCTIEPRWSLPTARERAAKYALLLTLYAPQTISDAGSRGYVKFCIEGNNFAVEESNFKYIKKVMDVLQDYMKIQAFSLPRITSNPYDTVTIYETLVSITAQMTTVDENLTRWLWMSPGRDASAHYRSGLPAAYMAQQLTNSFYSERTEYTNQESIYWNDVFIIHRNPSEMTYAVIRTQQLSGKVIVYECDDDFFSIPAWNHNAKYFTESVLDRIREVMENADFIFGSTEMLCQSFPEKSYHCPNLINFGEYNFVSKHEPFPMEIEGFFWKRDEFDQAINQNESYVLMNGSKVLRIETKEPLPVVRVLWAGSNTHDRDVQQIISAIRIIGETHGVAIQFVFFGYCPSEFLESYTQPGNTQIEMGVKEEFLSYIHYIQPVKFEKFRAVLQKIQPHIALCPLEDVPFNLSKSSLKLLEMGSMGIPVLCSDIGQWGPYNILKEKFPELLIKPNDTAAWVASIIEFSKNLELRVSTGNELRKWIYENHSWQTPNEGVKKWEEAFMAVHLKVLETKRAKATQGTVD